MYIGHGWGPTKGDAHHCKTLKVKREKEDKTTKNNSIVNKYIDKYTI